MEHVTITAKLELHQWSLKPSTKCSAFCRDCGNSSSKGAHNWHSTHQRSMDEQKLPVLVISMHNSVPHRNFTRWKLMIFSSSGTTLSVPFGSQPHRTELCDQNGHCEAGNRTSSVKPTPSFRHKDGTLRE
mgnify:CR=1 FL=1